MADKALDVYLNDHLGGSMLGSDLADRIRERSEGTPLGDVMTTVATEIEEDRQALVDLMDELGTTKNPLKQASAWLAEKASRVKFGGATNAEPDLGLFMALETLTLGVQGKLSLWKELKEIAGDHPPIAATNLDRLIQRAQSQHETLERERVSTGRQVFMESAAADAS